MSGIFEKYSPLTSEKWGIFIEKYLGYPLTPSVQNFAKLNIDLNDLFIGNQFILVFISLFDFCTVLERGGGKNPLLGQTQKWCTPLLQSYNKFGEASKKKSQTWDIVPSSATPSPPCWDTVPSSWLFFLKPSLCHVLIGLNDRLWSNI